jgi:glycosyltransferase involved in cell wall biosynthesis
MKIYAICLVKNEDDVIGETLVYATRYCDKVFVVDNGSTDRTWEIVQSLSNQHPQIVPFVQTPEPFDNGLRWLPYLAHHHELTDMDWWMILDGDEFLAEDPRPVIQQAMEEGADIIKVWQIQFYYTEKDYEAWVAGQDNRDTPIFARRRYYRIDHQEPRFFRNQSTGSWENSFLSRTLPIPPWIRTAKPGNDYRRVPTRKGRISRRLILNRHYQYRDPVQIEQRLRLRLKTPQGFRHVKSSGSTDWHNVIRASKNLDYHEEGKPWRFRLSGLANYYPRLLRYVLRSRIRRARRWLSDFVGA